MVTESPIVVAAREYIAPPRSALFAVKVVPVRLIVPACANNAPPYVELFAEKFALENAAPPPAMYAAPPLVAVFVPLKRSPDMATAEGASEHTAPPLWSAVLPVNVFIPEKATPSVPIYSAPPSYALHDVKLQPDMVTLLPASAILIPPP